jgi:SAM-dependent methyltransferase
MNKNFSKYAKYYDLLYSNKKYDDEVRYLTRLIRDSGVIGTNLLEFGSGTGKHAAGLVAEGFRVTGIEQSIEMVERATAKSLDGFICRQGNICDIELDEKFDAVISLFHVISYITSNEDLDKLFQKVYEHLKVGGIFAFDFWYGAAVLSQGVETRVRQINNNSIDITRIAEAKIRDQDDCVDVTYTIHMVDRTTHKLDVFSEVHTMRYFTLPELDHFANKNGLNRILQEEFLTKKQPSLDSWGVCAVYRKDS